jgi:hypothetical protein
MLDSVDEPFSKGVFFFLVHGRLMTLLKPARLRFLMKRRLVLDADMMSLWMILLSENNS